MSDNDLKTSALKAFFTNWKPSADESATDLVAVYRMGLDGVPGWAVQRAVQAYIRGKVLGHNAAFRPRTGELAQECERQIWTEVERQNAHITAERAALKADGKQGYHLHRRSELVTPETVDPNAMPALPDEQFKRLIEHRVDPSMQRAIGKVLPFKPTTQEAV
jgi:hypothetical protein